MTEIKTLGQINRELIEPVFGKIVTSDIVITNERMEHIKEHHPQDYDLFVKYGIESVESPDIILKDEKNKGTVFMIRKLPDSNLNVVVRVVLETDNQKLKNSVMTFYRIRNKNLDKLLKKNRILYIKS